MGPFLHLHHGLQFLVVLLCAVPQDHLDRLRVEDHSSLVHVTFHQNRWLVFLLGEYPILPKLLKLLLQGDCRSCRHLFGETHPLRISARGCHRRILSP